MLPYNFALPKALRQSASHAGSKHTGFTERGKLSCPPAQGNAQVAASRGADLPLELFLRQ